MLSNQMLDRRTYNICIKKGFASRKQLERAQKAQQEILHKSNSHTSIADILVILKIITEDQKESILFPKRDRKPERERIPPQEPLKFEAPSEPAAVEKETIKPISSPAFHIAVSWDRMEAHLHADEQDIPAPTLMEVKAAMEVHGIRYGFSSEEEILEYLSSGWPPEAPIKIATGKPPQPGIDARIEIHFEKDALKAGAIDESDRIDFKDRGEILQVKEGDLLAVKIPSREGLPGRDVCGGTVPPSLPKDMDLECGEGTERSEDGLQIFARQAGRPVVSRETVFSVDPRTQNQR